MKLSTKIVLGRIVFHYIGVLVSYFFTGNGWGFKFQFIFLSIAVIEFVYRRNKEKNPKEPLTICGENLRVNQN